MSFKSISQTCLTQLWTFVFEFKKKENKDSKFLFAGNVFDRLASVFADYKFLFKMLQL